MNAPPPAEDVHAPLEPELEAAVGRAYLAVGRSGTEIEARARDEAANMLLAARTEAVALVEQARQELGVVIQEAREALHALFRAARSI